MKLPQYEKICTVSAEAASLTRALRSKTLNTGGTGWEFSFQILVSFGSTDVKARLVWDENGEERKGPTTVISSDFLLAR
jgi:hypothetical protein